MADSKIISTSIYTYTKFHPTDKSKHTKFSVGMMNQNMVFRIHTSDDSGKFKTKADAEFYSNDMGYSEGTLYVICQEMLSRIKRMAKGEEIKSLAIYGHNSKTAALTESTGNIIFDAFNVDKNGAKLDRPRISITIRRRAEGDKDWTERSTMYINTTKIGKLYIAEDDVRFTEAYRFFDDLSNIILPWANRTSPKREKHWKDYYEANGGGNNNNNSKTPTTTNTKVAELDDDDLDVF